AKEADVLAVATETNAAAVVLGRVNLQKKVGWSITLWVHNGADGKLIEKLTVRGGLLPGLRKKLETSIKDVLAPTLEKAVAAEQPEPEPEELELPAGDGESLDQEAESFEDDVAPEPEPVGVVGASPLDLRVGMRFYQRSFNYSD